MKSFLAKTLLTVIGFLMGSVALAADGYKYQGQVKRAGVGLACTISFTTEHYYQNGDHGTFSSVADTDATGNYSITYAPPQAGCYQTVIHINAVYHTGTQNPYTVSAYGAATYDGPPATPAAVVNVQLTTVNP